MFSTSYTHLECTVVGQENNMPPFMITVHPQYQIGFASLTSKVFDSEPNLALRHNTFFV